ncbi:RmlC-like cupin [Pleomassaria siparia CBS 279.74]|uniref:RmlC-like cupin n=1 Tax=Pleomassaria siparia CBS 279.74 TaxID=1314801 RepID=A0A6G1JS67_9PLEO|nr:RmlC-like cupin [Pleomassaria siparia CBS 279.74]
MTYHFLLTNTILSLLLTLAHAVDKTRDPETNAFLKLAATNIDRYTKLDNNVAWTFDFPSQSTYTFSPGSVVNANAATFPALTGIGMTMAMLNLGPCAMLPPHAHQRGTNIVVAISGNTTSYMVGENGVGVVKVELVTGVLTVFPVGSLHSMQNNGCDNAQLVSALNSEDTGTINYINAMYQLPPDLLRAAFGDEFLDADGSASRIPKVGTGSVMGSYECRKRCGLV